jgi:hypothetical protein
MDLLNNLLNDDDLEIANRAAKLQKFIEMKNDKKISESEYTELVDDLLSIDAVNNEISEIERKQSIIKACHILMDVAKMAASAI